MQDDAVHEPERLLTPRKAADFLSLSPRWLELKRYHGDGPPFVRISSRCVRYRESDLREWINCRIRTSTSDLGHNPA
jgi:predicted DNA-binding transcriptional regulator AlpA